MFRKIALFTSLLIIAACSRDEDGVKNWGLGIGPDLQRQVNYQSACANDGTAAALIACDERADLFAEATARGARGFHLDCPQRDGSASEVRRCTAWMKRQFEDGGINFSTRYREPVREERRTVIYW